MIKKKIDSNASGFFLLGTLVCGEGEWGSETTLKGRAIRKLSHPFPVLYGQQSARAAGDVLVLGSRWYYKESLMQAAGLLGESNRGRRERGPKRKQLKERELKRASGNWKVFFAPDSDKYSKLRRRGLIQKQNKGAESVVSSDNQRIPVREPSAPPATDRESVAKLYSD